MKALVRMSIWGAMVLLAGATGSYFFRVSFWVASLIAGFALVANGLIAEWEDRHDGNSS